MSSVSKHYLALCQHSSKARIYKLKILQHQQALPPGDIPVKVDSSECSSISSVTKLNKELVITFSNNSRMYMVTMVELSLAPGVSWPGIPPQDIEHVGHFATHGTVH